MKLLIEKLAVSDEKNVGFDLNGMGPSSCSTLEEAVDKAISDARMLARGHAKVTAKVHVPLLVSIAMIHSSRLRRPSKKAYLFCTKDPLAFLNKNVVAYYKEISDDELFVERLILPPDMTSFEYPGSKPLIVAPRDGVKIITVDSNWQGAPDTTSWF